MANLYAQNGQYNEAREMLDSLVIFTNQSLQPRMFQQLAQMATNNNDLDDAAEFLNKALSLDPGNRNSYANLFMLFQRANDRARAVQELERYLELFPADSVVATQLEIYRNGGEFDITRAFGNR